MSWIKDLAEIAHLIKFKDGWKLDGSAEYIKLENVRFHE